MIHSGTGLAKSYIKIINKVPEKIREQEELMRFKTAFKSRLLRRPYHSVGEYLEEKAQKHDDHGAPALLLGLN